MKSEIGLKNLDVELPLCLLEQENGQTNAEKATYEMLAK